MTYEEALDMPGEGEKMTALMGCGCAANATDSDGKPVCAVHLGINAGAEQVAEAPNLKGRRAKCCYRCGSESDSNLNLAFFEHRPNQEFDSYYCGCWGWN